MLDLSAIDAVVSDMDGVLWRGDVALPGLTGFFDLVRRRRLPIVLASNNSSRSRAEYVAKLRHLGVAPVAAEEIITSRTAMVEYLVSRYTPGTGVYVIGSDGLAAAIREVGFRVGEAASVVVVGIDFALGYDKLRRASLLIREGADFLGTNGDLTLPSPQGLVPGNGAILAAIEAATGRAPTVIGKPSRPMFESALRLLGAAAGRTLMLGDRLDTDIAGAQAAGLRTALLLTGVATRAAAAAPGATVPDAIFAGLPDLLAAWTAT
jgi:4-nitrophenyl phosphatase